MTSTAKLFMHGRSQAVRLPKEFRFEGTEVRVSKVGDKVILEPFEKKPFDAASWRARLAEYQDIPFTEDGRDQGTILGDRKFAWRRIMNSTAKLFMHGRSQAVRLPKEFRLEGTEVRISKVGNKVILEPFARTEAEIAAVWAKLDALGGRDFLPDGIPDDPPVEPDPRVFFDE